MGPIIGPKSGCREMFALSTLESVFLVLWFFGIALGVALVHRARWSLWSIVAVAVSFLPLIGWLGPLLGWGRLLTDKQATRAA